MGSASDTVAEAVLVGPLVIDSGSDAEGFVAFAGSELSAAPIAFAAEGSFVVVAVLVVTAITFARVVVETCVAGLGFDLPVIR